MQYNGASTNGTCSRAIRVSSKGPTGTLWGTDWQNNLWRSTDDASTWLRVYTADGYTIIEHALELRSGNVLLEAVDSSGRRHLLRSNGTTSSFSHVFDFPTTEDRILGSQSWVETDQGIYVVEYGGSRGLTRSIWRSTDDGQSWSTVFSILGIRHFHSIQSDPYAPGRLWVTAGDSAAEPRIGYSDDAGVHFSWITAGNYPLSRTVALMFTRDSVYWGTDVPEYPSLLGKWSRTTGLVSTVANGLAGPYRVTVASGDVLASFSSAEPPYLSDQYIRVLTSNGGGPWSENRTPWRRVQDPAHGTSAPLGVTAPDQDGYFWVWYQNLERSYSGITNIEFRVIDRTPPGATIDTGPTGPTQSSSARFEFSSAGTASGFECKLDNGGWEACMSPKDYSGLSDGDHNFAVRGHDRAGNVDSSPATRQWTVQLLPTAAIDPPSGRTLTGEPVTFDASRSGGAGGRAISRYEWDLDGNGSFETDTGATPSATRSYDNPGNITVHVRVTDTAGLHAEALSELAIALAPPPGEVGVSIDDGAELTAQRGVTLSLLWPAYADRTLVSNDGGFRNSQQLPLSPTIQWQLSGTPSGRNSKIVYVRFLGGGVGRETYTDDIVLDDVPPLVVAARVTPVAGSNRALGLLKVAAEDAETTVAGLEVARRKKSPWTWRTFRRRLHVPWAVRYVRVRDAAGNESPWRRVRHAARHAR